MYFYQRLKDLREDSGKSQTQIAMLLNMKQQQYARYEIGDQEIPLHHFIALARYYNISLDYLAGLTDIPQTIDGTPYRISKNINITNKGGNNKINIKN